jgi:hypothetical protein
MAPAPTSQPPHQQAAAAAELECARACGVFDAFVANDDESEGYAALQAAVSRFRPDILPPRPPTPPSDAEAAAAAAAAASIGAGASRRAAAAAAPVLLLCGPAGGGREALAAQMLARLPDVFVVPPRITDRKPPAPAAATPGAGKTASAAATPAPGAAKSAGSAGAAGGSGGAAVRPADAEVVKPEAMARMAAAGQLAALWQDASGAQVAVTVEALRAASAAGAQGVGVGLVGAVASFAAALALCAARAGHAHHSFMPTTG